MSSRMLEHGHEVASEFEDGGGPSVAPQLRDAAAKERAADAVEASLAGALDTAAAARRWDVVAQIARELEARRFAGTNVVRLDVSEREHSK